MPEPSTPQLIRELALAFRKDKIPAGTLDVYLRELSDLPTPVLGRAVRELIRTSEFFPTVRAIRETAAERALGLPGEAEALAQVEARARWARLDETVRPELPPVVHPLVREAVGRVGGFGALRATDEPAVVRSQLLRLFRELRADAVRDTQLGDLTDRQLAAGGCTGCAVVSCLAAILLTVGEEDSKVAFVRLRSKSTGEWLVHPDLRPRLVAEAHERQSSLNDVAVGILSSRYQVPFEPTGRRSELGENDQQLTLRLPWPLYRAVDANKAQNRRKSVQDEIRVALHLHYGLRMPAPVRYQRRSRRRAAA